MRALSNTEIRATLDAIEGRHALRDRALFILGLATGFRISELLSLRVEDIRGALSDAPEAQIRVRRRSMKGKKRGRAVWVNEEAREYLRAYMATRPDARDNEPVFLSAFGRNKHKLRPVDRRWAWRFLKQTFRRALIFDTTVATHSMRKTFAQAIYEASGRDLFVTQKALDHTSPANTAKYLGAVDSNVKELVLRRRLVAPVEETREKKAI